MGSSNYRSGIMIALSIGRMFDNFIANREAVYRLRITIIFKILFMKYILFEDYILVENIISNIVKCFTGS